MAGLVNSSAADLIVQNITDSSPAVRCVVLLALSRLGDERVIKFLEDEDDSLFQEAVIAIDRMESHELAMKKAPQALQRFTVGKSSIADTLLNAYYRELPSW